MQHYEYTPRGVCARRISFDLEDGRIHGLTFMGGCNGNLKAIGKLLEGQSAREAAATLRGNDCGGRGTSCADQLSIALTDALEKAAREV